MLLGIEFDGTKTKINDDTVEGATVLMNRIGYLIDDKLKKLEAEAQAKPDKAPKNNETISKFNSIFSKIDDIANNPVANPEYADITLRVKILCKNMLDDRSKGWERQRQQSEKGPKKVEDLRKELEQKQIEEEKQR